MRQTASSLCAPFCDYYYGFEDENGNHVNGYKEMVDRLLDLFCLPMNPTLYTDYEKKDFVRLFGSILKMDNLLSSFDEFTEDMQILSPFDKQDYLTWYNDLHDELRTNKNQEKESIEDDLVFEMELVKQIQINIPYILSLVKEYHDKNCQDKEIIANIQKAIGASPDMRDKKELIMQFISRITPSKGDLEDQWSDYIKNEREKELQSIISNENLKKEDTRAFMEQAFKDGYVTTTGVSITNLLPPMNLFGKENSSRSNKKQMVTDKLKAFFDKYFNV